MDFKSYVDFEKGMIILLGYVLRVKIAGCALDHGWNMRNILIHNCFGKSKIGNLSHHICWKKNVASLYIAMDDGRHTACV